MSGLPWLASLERICSAFSGNVKELNSLLCQFPRTIFQLARSEELKKYFINVRLKITRRIDELQCSEMGGTFIRHFLALCSFNKNENNGIGWESFLNNAFSNNGNYSIEELIDWKTLTSVFQTSNCHSPSIILLPDQKLHHDQEHEDLNENLELVKVGITLFVKF